MVGIHKYMLFKLTTVQLMIFQLYNGAKAISDEDHASHLELGTFLRIAIFRTCHLTLQGSSSGL